MPAGNETLGKVCLMASISWRARSLKAALRAALEQAGMSGREAAETLGIPRMRLHRWLSNEDAAPDVDDVKRLLDCVGADDTIRDGILTMAATPDVDWLVSGPPGINPHLAAVLELERYAVRITEWQPLVWPGLLQSSGYARAVFAGSGDLTHAEVEASVMMRIGRRDALTRHNPIEFTALVGLPAVHGLVGGPEVMAEQLSHVRGVTNLANVTIQLVDLSGGWTPGHAGGFILYEFANMPPAVHIEHYRTGAVIGEAADVAAYKSAAETIRRAAMSPEQSAGLIADAIPNSNMETTS
jgi:transcriptional regulator with XRE-family HTH domain